MFHSRCALTLARTTARTPTLTHTSSSLLTTTPITAATCTALLHTSTSLQNAGNKPPKHHHATPSPISTTSHAATNAPPKQTANTAADIQRIYKEQVRQRTNAQQELFPWEIVHTNVTGQLPTHKAKHKRDRRGRGLWKPAYEDERNFYYASKTQEGQEHLNGKTFERYLRGFGSRYLLSKHCLPSGAHLTAIRMTDPREMRVELSMSGGVLHYWFLNMSTGQHPISTAKPQIESAKMKSKGPKTLKVDLSRANTYKFLSQLHHLWPRKDERDYTWKTTPRREHGQYRMQLNRILAEGPTLPLNRATQSFIDHLSYQLTFHFRESKKQNRNLHWLQFMGIPGVKINKKHGGEIQIPTLRALE